MAKQVKIWDKVSPINGVPAEKVTPNWTNVEEVVLILDENGRVLEMNDPAILKQNLGVTEDKTAQEIGELWVAHEEEMNNKQAQDKITMEELKARQDETDAAIAELAAAIAGDTTEA